MTPQRDLARMFLLGAATLMFEVLLTRIAAVTLFANLAFGVIALSLFGLAVGSAQAARSRFASDDARDRAIRWALLGAAAFTLLSGLLATRLPLVPEDLAFQGRAANTFLQRRSAIELDPGQIRWPLVALLVAVQAVPFAMAGYAQAHAFAMRRARESVLYGVDLAGATLGSLVTLVLLRKLGASDGVAVVALLFGCAGLVGARGIPERAAAGVIAAFVVVVLVARPFGIKHAAGFTESRIIAVDWSALARIGLYERAGAHEPMLVVDNTSATDVAFAHDDRFEGNLERVPYVLRPEGDVLVIGAGGGQEIETALATAPGRKRNIDAVELADGEERLMRRFFGSRPDFLLDQPGVSYRIGDGRSFLEMTPRKWDVIEMKEVNFHTFAGQASSAWTPSLLFTREAIRSELSHLTPRGLLAINRGMYQGGDLAITLELLATVRAATDALGWDLGPRLAIVDRPKSSGFQRMCVIAASPFDADEMVSIRATAAKAGLHVRRLPEMTMENVEGVVSGAREEALADVAREHGIHVQGLTDDKPFGYQYLSFANAMFGNGKGSLHMSMQRADYRFLATGCLVLLCVTALLMGRAASALPTARRGAAVRQLVVCALLGIAFMLLEVILVERTSLLLGHPTVAFVAVVTSMLCGLGAGSVVSGRLLPEAETRRAWILASLVLVGVALIAALPAWVAPSFRALDAGLRPWLAGAAMFAAAFPLGMLLPSVLRIAAATQAASPAACWSTNAACSVVGTLAAALLVRTAGFEATSRVAWLLYACALVVWIRESVGARAEA